jgi:hypothetical protein
MNGLQKSHAVNKVGLSDQHHQIDGVKIFLTPKTSGQIGLWVYGGVKPMAQGAPKAKTALGHPRWDRQRFFDQPLNVNPIAQGIKLVAGKTPFCHVMLPDRVWLLNCGSFSY